MRKTIMILALLPLAGCASAIMQNYVGKDVKEAILDYGPPVNVMDMGADRRAYQWKMNNSYVIPGYSTTTRTGNAHLYGNSIHGTSTAQTVSTPATMGSQTCVYTLFAERRGKEDWVVTDYRSPGVSCE